MSRPSHVSDIRPVDAYVSIARNGLWYSISNRELRSDRKLVARPSSQPRSTTPTQTVISAPLLDDLQGSGLKLILLSADNTTLVQV